MFTLDINTQHQVQISSIDANVNLIENLLKNSFQTRWRFYFSKTDLHGCNRSYRLNYLINLFVYGILSDFVF